MGRTRKGRRRRPIRAWGVLGAAVGLAALGFGTAGAAGFFLPAAAPTPTDPPALHDVPAAAFERGRTLVVGESGGFSAVNPLYAASEGDVDLCAALFEPLERLGPDGTPVLCAAASKTVSADGTSVVFTLDPTRTFPDGTLLLPTDVAFTYAVLADPTYDGPLRGRFDAILSVEADVNAGTVTFTLAPGTLPDGADARLFTLGLLEASHYAYPYGHADRLRDTEASPAGTGGWRIESLTADLAVLVPRRTSAGGVERLVLRSVDEERKVAELAAGAIDVARVARSDRSEARIAGLVGCTEISYAGAPSMFFVVGNTLAGSPTKMTAPIRLALLSAVDDLAEHWAKSPDAVPSEAEPPADDATHPRLLYFRGVEAAESSLAGARARAVAAALSRALPVGSPAFVPIAVGWPELAALAAGGGRYDALLLPVSVDGRTPAALRLAADRASLGASSDANATVLTRASGTLLASRRLSGLVANAFASPFLPVGVGFLDSLDELEFLDLLGATVPTAASSP